MQYVQYQIRIYPFIISLPYDHPYPSSSQQFAYENFGCYRGNGQQMLSYPVVVLEMFPIECLDRLLEVFRFLDEP